MAEIRTIPEKILASGIKDTSVDAVGKFSKAVIHHNAGAPTAADDTGLGYAVGSIWVDTTNGDMYVAASVTAEDANWKNMEGDEVNPPFTIQGSGYGYSCGHMLDPGSPSFPGNINRFAMVSSGNGSDVGELATAVRDIQSGSIRDDSYGFAVGGINPPSKSQDFIQRFTLASPTTVVDIGEMVKKPHYSSGSTNGSYGFVYGGRDSNPPEANVDTIEKFALAAPPVTATDSGMEITESIERGAGLSDTANAYGYLLGGVPIDPSGNWPPSGGTLDTIEKFSFTGSGSTSDHSEMSTDVIKPVGTSSTTHGFRAGGVQRPPYTDTTINEKFAFAAPTTIDDVGDLTQARSGIQGASGDTHGYHAGGADWGPSFGYNVIDRFSTSADANSTDVGELSEIGASGSGFESD